MIISMKCGVYKMATLLDRDVDKMTTLYVDKTGHFVYQLYDLTEEEIKNP